MGSAFYGRRAIVCAAGASLDAGNPVNCVTQRSGLARIGLARFVRETKPAAALKLGMRSLRLLAPAINSRAALTQVTSDYDCPARPKAPATLGASSLLARSGRGA